MRNVRALLLYPPEQTWPDTMCKPNGSLAYPMLAGALIEAGIEVEIYDACVGNEKDNLEKVFYNSTPLPTGMLRTGVSDDRILEKVSDFDVIGITSIFSHQETMVLKTANLIKKKFPEKVLVTGGVNARHRMDLFFSSGFDLICTSEAEKTIVSICNSVAKGSNDFSSIPFLAWKKEDKTVVNNNGEIFWDLDDLPMPAWHLLPNERYWKIGRPHGGHFEEGEDLRYASMMTSLGCPFSCTFCHIAGETKDSNSGPIKKFRIKSDERVIRELEILKSLNVKQVFIEDDSIFGKKKRAIRLLNKINNFGFDILDVNGVNIIHLLKNGEPDPEVIEALVAAGFRDIVLPFESSSPRIIRKYASNKWNIERSNVTDLIKECKKAGLRVAGNFMIGYPDESREEIRSTVEYAKDRMSDGLDAANFFLVMPLPGTPLFDQAVKNGNLPKEYNPDRMHWQKANMKNTRVPAEELEAIRDRAWEDTNRPEFRNYKKGMIVDKNTGEIHKK